MTSDPPTASAAGSPFLPTRSSLLSRLKQWDNSESWREFFDTYGPAIHGLALKASMSHPEAEEVVQETMVAVSKQIPDFRYDRARGTFKGWLFTIARRSIWRQLRKRHPHQGSLMDQDELEQMEAANVAGLEDSWNQEWRRHLLTAAVARVRKRVAPRQFQMFDLYVTQDQPMETVTRTLDVNRAQVYMAKLRISALLRKEIAALEAEG